MSTDEDTIYKRIYNLIDQERRERINDISEIHSRIDQVLNAVQGLVEKANPQGNGQVLALFATVVISLGAILGFSIRGVNASSLERTRHNKELVEIHINHLEDKIQNLNICKIPSSKPIY